VRAQAASQRLLAPCLATCKARGWLKPRGPQRTDAPQVFAALRTLQRFACVLEALPSALNQLSAAAPAWVQQHVPLDGSTRYGLRSDQTRLPQDTRQREALARQSGADGSQRRDAGWATERAPYCRALAALEALRQLGGHH
jgi:hypothetical protein